MVQETQPEQAVFSRESGYKLRQRFRSLFWHCLSACRKPRPSWLPCASGSTVTRVTPPSRLPAMGLARLPRHINVPRANAHGGTTWPSGHDGKLAPPEQVKDSYDIRPQTCRQCGHPLAGQDPRHIAIKSPRFPQWWRRSSNIACTSWLVRPAGRRPAPSCPRGFPKVALARGCKRWCLC